jgi:hypothetical protein
VLRALHTFFTSIKTITGCTGLIFFLFANFQQLVDALKIAFDRFHLLKMITQLFTPLYLLSVIHVFGQIDSVKSRVIIKANTNYKAVLVSNDVAYCISKDGRAVLWDLRIMDTLAVDFNDTSQYKFTCVTKDDENIFLGTDKGHIFSYSAKEKEFSLFKKLKYPIYFIIVNSSGKPFVIVPNAVYDPTTKKSWTRFRNHTDGLIVKRKVLGLVPRRVNTYFQMPSYCFIDSQDRVWMTSGFGEFGGSLEVFDASRLKIINNTFGINPSSFHPQSVFEGNNNQIFITAGLQHFMNWGEIYEITSSSKSIRVFENSGLKQIDRKTGKVINEGALFIGPGTFRKSDNSIYFSTDRGLFRSVVLNDSISSPKFWFNPGLHWSRESLAIGAAMSVKYLQFIDDRKLLFLTTNDGIGILDEKSLIFLK